MQLLTRKTRMINVTMFNNANVSFLAKLFQLLIFLLHFTKAAHDVVSYTNLRKEDNCVPIVPIVETSSEGNVQKERMQLALRFVNSY